MTQPSPEAIASARASQKAFGIPASVSLAQWALESGWGQHTPAGSNNPFGIKALPGQPYVVVPTREVFKGKSVIVQAAFRKFASLAEAFASHAKLLATAGVYAHARAALPDAFAFADALTGTYATDPRYGDLLASVMRASNLTRFDT
jgi:flagellum-specific peptidoglycan hydrolase FlgJ